MSARPSVSSGWRKPTWHGQAIAGGRLGSRSLEAESRGAHGAAQRRSGRRQRSCRQLGGAGLAQSQSLPVSGSDPSHQSAAQRDLGAALPSGFQVAAGSARSPGGSGSGGRGRGDAAERGGGGGAQRHGVLGG